MKTFLTALAVVGGLTIAGGAAVAAPVSAPALAPLNTQSLFTPAQYYGGYGYRPHCYYVRRCSGYYPYQRCWRERVCH